MNAATRLATLAISGGTFLVLLLFAPALEAPFLVPKFAALELSAALGVVAFALARTTAGGPTWTRPVTIGALLVLATTAIAWIVAASRPFGAPYAIAAMARWGSLFGVACGASVLANSHDARQRALEAVTVSAAAVAVVGLLQHLDVMPLSIPVISTPGSTFGNRNAAAEVMALALPLGLGAVAGARGWTARTAMLAALGLQLLFLAATRTRGAWLGAALGLGTALLLVRPRLRWSRASLAVAIAAFVAVAIAASIPGHYNPRDAGDRKRYAGVVQVLEEGFDARSTALRTRFGLWRRSLTMVRDYPLLGVGPGNWPVVFPRYAEPDATRDGVLSATLVPRQAHNDLLERAAETGVPGLGALGVLLAGAAIASRRRMQAGDSDTRATAAGATGALVAIVAVSVASFPLDMPGPLALSGLALGLVATEVRPPVALSSDQSTAPQSAALAARSRALAWVAVALGATLFGCAAVRAERSVRSSTWLARAESALQRNHGKVGAAEAIGALNFALDAEPNDYRARLRAAQMLLREHRSGDSARAARGALALEPYAPNAWAALSAAELDGGNAEAARGDATHALALLHDYPFALHLRALAADKRGDAAAAQTDREELQALASGPENDPTARAARALLVPAH